MNIMSNLINQVLLFRALNLQPVSSIEIEIWNREIEKNLIKMNEIRESYVEINKTVVNRSTVLMNIRKCSSGRVLRTRKIKLCCKMCK